MKSLITVAAVLSLFAGVFGQSTEFTYQGSISDSGAPANGNHDFEFLLFDSPAGGTQVGQSVSSMSVPVSDGLFSVSLDFGDQFPGAERYLEIRVRPSGTGGMTILAPRQKLGAVPYAVKSTNATNADNASNASNADQLGGVAATEYVVTTDPRMTDARAPLPNSPSYVQNGTFVQPSSNFNISGNGTAGGTLRANVIRAETQFDLRGSRVLGGDFVDRNLFVGLAAGAGNTTGDNNSFYGMASGDFNSSGSFNSFFGAESGGTNDVGNNNAFFGFSSGFNNDANGNSFFGSRSGSHNFNGENNAFFGWSAGRENTSGSSNSFFGARSGESGQTGDNNSFFGFAAGFANEAGENSFFGSSAGSNNTTGNLNSFFGSFSGDQNTTGSGNSFFGASSGSVNQNGAENAFFGGFAGSDNLSGSSNSFFGYRSGDKNTTGGFNTFVGRSSGEANLNGSVNVFVGSESGLANTSGGANVFVGSNAGDANMTGASNTFIGRDAGDSNTTGSSNSALGRGSDVGSGALSFATAIGSNAVVTTSNTVQLGRNGLDIVRIGTLGPGGATSLCINGGNDIASCSSSLRYKSGIETFSGGSDILKRLRPVTFAWKDSGTLDLGLVAEEVAEIDPLLVTYNSRGEVEGVKYDRIGVVLVNVVKEQQNTIKVQGSKLKVQSERIEKLETELAALKALVCA
ncbi:MAG: tail fiber domain-containing protein, partial [Aridibacter famidurans]|nr:tail fiber domain-containing protein [Aridibacter famidurans]